MRLIGIASCSRGAGAKAGHRLREPFVPRSITLIVIASALSALRPSAPQPRPGVRGHDGEARPGLVVWSNRARRGGALAFAEAPLRPQMRLPPSIEVQRDRSIG